MRLAEEEKLRKEMSAKMAKEEAERKHQVSGECASPHMFTPHWPSVLCPCCFPLRLYPGRHVLGQDRAGGL